MSTYERYIISLQDRFSGPMNRAADSTKRLDSSISKVGVAISRMGAIAAAAGLGIFARSVVMTTAKVESMRNAIEFAAGGGKQGENTFKNLIEKSDELGISLQGALEGFQTFSSSVIGTGISLEETQKIFNNVSVGVSAMNLSAERSKLVFLALGQMASKGVVSMEELRRQLGDSLPGALSIGARSMGVTVKEFDKMVESGQVLSKDFLPKFAQEVKNTFSGLLPKSTNSLQANINRLNNEFFLLKDTIGTELKPVMIKALGLLSDFIEKTKKLIEWIKEHKALIKGLAIVITAAFVPSMVAAIASVVNFTTVFGIMSKVMMINPFVAIGTALVALGIAMYDAYQRGTKFTAFINGIGSALENLGKRLENTALRIRNVFFAATRQFDRIKQVEKVGESVAKAYSKGYNNTISKFQREAALSGARRGGSGAGNVAGTDGTTVAGGGTVGSVAKSTPTTITGSAPKVFNINVDKLIDGFTISTTNLTESAGQIKEKVTMALAEALADLQLTAS